MKLFGLGYAQGAGVGVIQLLENSGVVSPRMGVCPDTHGFQDWIVSGTCGDLELCQVDMECSRQCSWGRGSPSVQWRVAAHP